MAVQVAGQLVGAYAELRQLPVVVQSLVDQLLQGGHPQAAATVQDAKVLRDLHAVRQSSCCFPVRSGGIRSCNTCLRCAAACLHGRLSGYKSASPCGCAAGESSSVLWESEDNLSL